MWTYALELIILNLIEIKLIEKNYVDVVIVREIFKWKSISCRWSGEYDVHDCFVQLWKVKKIKHNFCSRTWKFRLYFTVIYDVCYFTYCCASIFLILLLNTTPESGTCTPWWGQTVQHFLSKSSVPRDVCARHLSL